ncbi:Wzz/FepE/Etk N-terminal domain-containing protein [Taibaiella soli]|uniref:Wzz/FepE/Etk N-terminal domain-containing protein n=1 Tax=Taibaiella soli TaxID=1649169 RepID=UPI0014027B18|nr:Wzz/FepE/Etk N-terminal domain-containing protein [Taibaiella soli]
MIQTLRERKRLIRNITILTIIIGVILHFLTPKKYEAEVTFMLKNPIYADRNNLYNNETKFIDYFANEEDIDRLITMAQSDSVQNKIIKEMNLVSRYKIDTLDKDASVVLKKTFNNRLRIYRTENRNVVLNFADKNDTLARKIAVRYVGLLDSSLRGFYNEMRVNMHASIVSKIHEQDSTINVLTDTLTRLRDEYGIYDILSPSRYNLMLSSLKTNGKPGFARGVEQIQNIESVKDELVSDRAHNITLANQYTTGTKMNELPLTKIVSITPLPIKATGPGLKLTIVVCALGGLFFSILYALVIAFYRNILSKRM